MNTHHTLDLCAGPGGWDEGARILGLNLGIVGLDISKDAVATARAAGHHRLDHTDGDITDHDPLDPRWASITGLITSTPCPTFSDAGKRTGRADIQHVLDAGTGYGECRCNNCLTALTGLAGDVQEPMTALAAETYRWALQLPNLRWVAAENAPAALPLFEDVTAELYSDGWEYADTAVLDATDYGSPSHRRRAYLMASRYTTPDRNLTHRRTQEFLPAPSLAEAIGWPTTSRVLTRGQRVKGNYPAGLGDSFAASGPSWCLTGKARSWYPDHDHTIRLTSAEAGYLNGFPAGYPWQGTMTSQFQQIGDVMSPPVAAALLGTLTRTPWETPLTDWARARGQDTVVPAIPRHIDRRDGQHALF